jgi:hypothetical protein
VKEIEEVREDRNDPRGSSRRRSRDEDDYDDDYEDRRRRRYEDEPPRRRRRDEDEEDRPRRGQQKRRGGMPVWPWIVGISLIVIGIVVVVLILVLGGGGNGPGINNFSKVQKGMTEQQVIDLLGKPDTISDKGVFKMEHSKMLVWYSGEKAFGVKVQGGKVLYKQRGKHFSMPGRSGYILGPAD